MVTSETRVDNPTPIGGHVPEPQCDLSEALLREAMEEVTARQGAVVSMAGGEVRVDAAYPDDSWVRSVDLYIARAMLTRHARSAKPLLSSTERAYIPLTTGNRFAVLILSDF